MRVLFFLILAAFGGLLIYASFGLPNQGDPGAAVNQELSVSKSTIASSYYIKHAYRDTHTPNIVTAILADYRSFDTLGEEVVIFAAGMLCFLLLFKAGKNPKSKP